MNEPKTGAELIAAERQRQIEKEGWTPAHDDTHREGELAMEASLWAVQSTVDRRIRDGLCGTASHRAAKPPVRQLVIAGALIAAEIDRLLRAGQKADDPMTAKEWSVLLETNDGSTHPVRYVAPQGRMIHRRDVELRARGYLGEHPDWLVGIQAIEAV